MKTIKELEAEPIGFIRETKIKQLKDVLKLIDEVNKDCDGYPIDEMEELKARIEGK